MRLRRRQVLGAAAIAAAGVVVAAIGTGLVVPERHADGDGPLASLNLATTHISTSVEPSGSPVWTFGYRLCLAHGDQPAVIDSVGPTQTIGAGFRYLGALVRTFDPEPGAQSPHEPIGSVHGFPPPPEYAPDFLSPAIGYPVSVLCPRDGPSTTYTELLVGLAADGTDGGGWLGIDVGYTVAGRHRIVTLRYDQLICGPAVPDACGDASPTPVATDP